MLRAHIDLCLNIRPVIIPIRPCNRFHYWSDATVWQNAALDFRSWFFIIIFFCSNVFLLFDSVFFLSKRNGREKKTSVDLIWYAEIGYKMQPVVLFLFYIYYIIERILFWGINVTKLNALHEYVLLLPQRAVLSVPANKNEDEKKQQKKKRIVRYGRRYCVSHWYPD